MKPVEAIKKVTAVEKPLFIWISGMKGDWGPVGYNSRFVDGVQSKLADKELQL